jgi:hypothetical protein
MSEIDPDTHKGIHSFLTLKLGVTLLQKILEYLQGKDKILKASLTRIHEARDLEDECWRS